MQRRRITDRQVRLYMDENRQGATQLVAAARAGFSERTGRRIEADPILPSKAAAAGPTDIALFPAPGETPGGACNEADEVRGPDGALIGWLDPLKGC